MENGLILHPVVILRKRQLALPQSKALRAKWICIRGDYPGMP